MSLSYSWDENVVLAAELFLFLLGPKLHSPFSVPASWLNTILYSKTCLHRYTGTGCCKTSQISVILSDWKFFVLLFWGYQSCHKHRRSRGFEDRPSRCRRVGLCELHAQSLKIYSKQKTFPLSTQVICMAHLLALFGMEWKNQLPNAQQLIQQHQLTVLLNMKIVNTVQITWKIFQLEMQ